MKLSYGREFLVEVEGYDRQPPAVDANSLDRPHRAHAKLEQERAAGQGQLMRLPQ
jgi:hypothetical protein